MEKDAFEHGMVVGARQAGPSISKTVDLLGFSQKISSEWQLCGRKCLVDATPGAAPVS
uniref:Uncharacterized protein n=1 Tax=Cyprinus carpio carpio TaxID=630221 RepID=A0A9J8CAX5_CYPCA